MPSVQKRAAARADLVDLYVYLVDEAGEKVADRFLDKAESSFNLLATQPKMGKPLTLRRPELAGMRLWRVEDFDSFLIFYLPRSDGVTIVRVLHGSRDWWSLLGLIS